MFDPEIYNEAGTRLRTVRDILRFAVSRFGEHRLHFGHGNSNAWDEAVYLVLHTLHLPPDRLEAFLDARLTDLERAALLHLIQRRVEERIPAAYLTGEAWLGDYRFTIDQRVIVPRSFIAELLFEGLEPWIDDPADVGRVLDLCTGSACLAIIAADLFSNAEVDAVDLSPDALAVATINVEQYRLSERVRLVESNLFDDLDRQFGTQQYDLILSNPPYVNDASMAVLPDEYRREPKLALAGGSDGLDLVRCILAQAAAHLKPGGLLVVEVGHERHHVESAFPELPCTWLSTSAGDDMVFLLERHQLIQN